MTDDTDEGLLCEYCGADNEPGRETCVECGRPLATPAAVTQVRRCAACGSLNPPSLAFCATCGSPMAARAPVAGVPCPRCGGANRAGVKFCQHCGQPLPVAPAVVAAPSLAFAPAAGNDDRRLWLAVVTSGAVFVLSAVAFLVLSLLAR